MAILDPSPPGTERLSRFEVGCGSERSYSVVASTGLLSPDRSELRDAIAGRRLLAVTTPTVGALHGLALRRYLDESGASARIMVLPLGEERKTMETVLRICDRAQSTGLGRRGLLVAFGGGICCDVVSLAASLIRRGIPYLCLPSTLVAQVDAAVGLKSGVNFGGKKNYLGSFTPPEAALVDVSFLRTLPPDELRRGIAEILKMALIRDEDLFLTLVEHGPDLIDSHFSAPAWAAEAIVHRSIELMLDELSQNPYEDRTYERLVDFGHTFSGAIEELSLHRVRHGDAVAIDMALSCLLAVELGVLSEAEWDGIHAAYEALGLPLFSECCTPDVLAEALEAATAHRGGRLNLVVPTAIGSATFVRDASTIRGSLLALVCERLRSAEDDRAIVAG